MGYLQNVKLLIASALILSCGCNNSPETSPTTSPSVEATPTTSVSAEGGKVTIITPTPSVYPDEPTEGKAQLVNFFNEVLLGSRAGDYQVFLKADDYLGIDFIKSGNPAFSSGTNSTMLNMTEQMNKELAEHPEFKVPLTYVLDAYLSGSYEVKEGTDPLKRSDELLQKAEELKAAMK